MDVNEMTHIPEAIGIVGLLYALEAGLSLKACIQLLLRMLLVCFH
jgi:hypothetical protein